jgi:glycosyltransferase involved in cell wall biosynthesis
VTSRQIVLTANFSPWSRYTGGGQRSTHALACALAERGHRVSVVYTKPPWEAVQVPPVLPYAVHWATFHALTSHRAASLRVLNAVSVARTVRSLARRAVLDVVHAQGEEGALVTRVVGCPFVLTPRYPSYPDGFVRRTSSLPGKAWSWLRHAKYHALAEAARQADLVCPTSRASAAMVQQAFDVPAARMRVVPNGVDPRFLALTRAPDAQAGPIVFFGRVERSKGIDVLLEAFVGGAHRERTLCVVGEGDALPWLRREVHARGIAHRVELCGWEAPLQLAERLRTAAVAVLPSREESFGNAMVEAMAAGAPLVTTSAGSLAEVVVAERTALVVPPGDVPQLQKALHRVLSCPPMAAALGQAGRVHVRERYAWPAVAARYEQLYDEARRARAHAARRA